MKLLIFLTMLPLFSIAEIVIPESGGAGSTVQDMSMYSDTGWYIGDSPDAMTVHSRCQGDGCPQVLFGRMGFNSGLVYDVVSKKTEMNQFEIAARLGFSQVVNDRAYRTAVLIVDGILRARSQGVSKENYVRQQMAFISSSEKRESRLYKAQMMAEIASRLASMDIK